MRAVYRARRRPYSYAQAKKPSGSDWVFWVGDNDNDIDIEFENEYGYGCDDDTERKRRRGENVEKSTFSTEFSTPIFGFPQVFHIS